MSAVKWTGSIRDVDRRAVDLSKLPGNSSAKAGGAEIESRKLANFPNGFLSDETIKSPFSGYNLSLAASGNLAAEEEASSLLIGAITLPSSACNSKKYTTSFYLCLCSFNIITQGLHITSPVFTNQR